MFGRIFLVIVTIVSVAWLGYATFDRVTQGKIFRAASVFGKEDGEVLILQNPAQLQTLATYFNSSNPKNQELLGQLNMEFVSKIYVSKMRGQLLIETKDAVTKTTLTALFSAVGAPTIDKESFRIGSFNGSFDKNMIYLSQKSYPLNSEPWKSLHYDTNADAAIIQFVNEQPTIVDLYVKENGVIEYKTALKSSISGTKINDKVVFASVIPASVSSYEFYESDYLRYSQPKISESPLNTWIKYGLVRVVINNQEAIITDYIDGQDPIQVLYDYYHIESKEADNDYFKGNPLTSLLKESAGYYVYRLDDHVVISANRAICETIVGDYKLGNTLAQNQEKAASIYEKLPQKVNYRKVTNTDRLAVSIYASTLLTTIVGETGTKQKEVTATSKSPASFVVGNAKNLFLLSAHSFFVTTSDHKILFFEHDKKKWEHDLGEPIIGTPEMIDLYANEKAQLMVSTAKKIHVFDINNNEPSGFPIDLEEQVSVQSPLFYRWKGNGFFLVSAEKGRLVQFDNQGRELTVIRTQLNSIALQPAVWVSANKPFVGIYGDNRFEMIQLDTRRSFRIFNAAGIESVVKLSNEVKLFGLQQNQLIAYDQRGGLMRFEKFTDAKIVLSAGATKSVVVQNKQDVRLFNESGLQWGAVKMPFTDIVDAQIFTTQNGTSFVAAIDGLENKVHLFKTNGDPFKRQTLDGSKLVRYTEGHIFTVIDNLLVRYSINE